VSLPPFQRFLDDHREPVYRYLVAVAGRQEADDCFQETLVSALRAYPRLHDGANLRAWALKIANRKAIDAHRARTRRPEATDEIGERAAAHDDGAGPADAALWELVRSLPPKQRAAVVLRFVVDLSHAEAADVIGCSEEAARRNLHEGLEKLRKGWTP
jgi:RNA polymerase sigma factor (sigma-70 family)